MTQVTTDEKLDLIIHLLRTKESVVVSMPREAITILEKLYCEIWCEACYDCTNDEWRKFGQKLLPLIQRLNELLEFKK